MNRDEKRFDEWNELKKRLHYKNSSPRMGELDVADVQKLHVALLNFLK